MPLIFNLLGLGVTLGVSLVARPGALLQAWVRAFMKALKPRPV